MRKTLIYVGPTLYGVGMERQKHELWFGPAKQTDILKGVARYNPAKIVLIDGIFNHFLSVWVKELLFALAEGVTLIGASSMGALRAAELWRYGMVGVGKIFEAYKSGDIQDDAWVALSYDPETNRPLTHPPCGMRQKQLDAIEAITLARTELHPSIILDKRAVRDIINPILDRILEEDFLLYG